IRPASRPSNPAQPASTSIDSAAGVTNSVACPPSTSMKNTSSAVRDGVCVRASAKDSSVAARTIGHLRMDGPSWQRRFYRLLDDALLEIGDDVLEGNALGRHDELRHVEVRSLLDVIRNELDADPRARRQHDGALDHVLELAHVAWPVVFGEQVERFGHHLQIAFAIFIAVLLEEMMDEQGDIVLAVAQRLQLNRDDVQAIEEIIAEL